MILIRLRGGLGNQLFQYAFGRMLSIKYSDELLLDLTWYESELALQYGRSFELTHFTIASKMATRQQIKKAAEGIAANKRTWTGKPKWELISDKPLKGFDPEHLKKTAKKAVVDGYWQSERYFSKISGLLYHEISLKTGMKDKGGQLAEEMKTGNSVSIHIRRGDYLDKAKKHHGVLAESYYPRAVEFVQKKFTDLRYYLFSDDPEWCAKNLDYLTPKIIVSDQSKYGIFNPAEEMMLMSACQHNIIANSSFSWWGGWLNQNKDKVVVAPKTWFAGRSQMADLIPADWIKIDNDFKA